MNFYKYLLRKFGVSRKSVYIVSGLPRSGTSMMMKMLETGGIPAFIDNIRVPDEDNPKGYYEYERVKQLAKDSAWISEACGKAVKIISMLLVHLPPGFEYKVIFMQRNMNEILASQAAMLARTGKTEIQISDENLALKFESHLEEVKNWIAQQQNIDVLYINYNALLISPYKEIQKINTFFNHILDEGKMLEIIDPTLYRQRKKEE